ncbi:MAG: cadherin-like beta sandwich domain-containing protein [Marinilabiliaceae bacterium]|nr:cadherin-like beta sandwich domain-containing protein [Marinilabiliaceae bacterium]
MKKAITAKLILFLILLIGISGSINGQKFIGQEISGRVITEADDGTARIYSANVTDNRQGFELIENIEQPGKYYIVNTTSGKYLSAVDPTVNTWNMEFIADTTGRGNQNYLFNLVEIDTTGRYYIWLERWRLSGNERYLGTDQTDDGSSIYSDKSLPNANKNIWIIDDVSNFDASLEDIELSVDYSNIDYVDETNTYTFTVAANATTVTVTGIPYIENATVTDPTTIDVSSGHGTTTITVTSTNGVSVITYTINIELDQGNSNATLNSLETSVGQLFPTFEKYTNNYEIIVPSNTTSLVLSASTSDGGITTEGLGTIDLSGGPKTASVIVTASDKVTTNTYVINIRYSNIPEGVNFAITQNVSGLVIGATATNPNFAKIYSASTDSLNQQMSFVKAEGADQYFIINGKGEYLQAGDVPAGNNHWDVLFISDTTITTSQSYIIFKVFEVEPGIFTIQSSQRLEASQNYYIGSDNTNNGDGIYNDKNPINERCYWKLLDPASFDASLSGLSLSSGSLSSAFDPSVYNYEATVPSTNRITTITATASSAANGAIVEYLNNNSATVDLTLTDRFKDTITVVSPNTYLKKQYIIDFSVDYGDADIYLNSFVPSTGILFPAFDNEITNYTLIVPTSENSVIITTTARNNGTVITGNESAFDITSGSVEASINVKSKDSSRETTFNVTIRHSNIAESTPYFIIQKPSGLAIGENIENGVLRIPCTDSLEQKMQFISTGITDEFFIINGNGYYLAAGDSSDHNDNFWDVKFAEDTTTFTLESFYKFEILEVEPGVFTIQNIHSRDSIGDVYLGTDNNNDGSGIYNNKSLNENAKWHIAAFEGIDATLSDISLSPGSLNELFDSNIFEYTVTLPNGTNSIDITATTNDTNASVDGDGIINLLGGTQKVAINVTSANGAVKKTYNIEITVLTDINNKEVNTTTVYPTVTSGSFNVYVENAKGMISVYNLSGILVLQKSINSNNEIIDVPTAGIYFIVVKTDNVEKVTKVVKTK